MRILLINYAYFKIGGPETYMFNVKALLESHGHTVIPFSLKFAKNEPCEYSDYFADSPAGPDTFFYDEMKKGPALVARMLGRQFYSPHVYKKLQRLIRDTKPDVAYVLHFLKRMSPSVIDACAAEGVPVVVRLSDFGLICANSIFFRDGKVCQLCEKNQFYGLKYRCAKGSLFASAVRYLAHRFHESRGVFKKIDTLVCPSKFMSEVFRRNPHFQASKAEHLPTFIDATPLSLLAQQTYEDRIKMPLVVYLGRLDYDKGVDLLIDAAIELRRRGMSVVFKLIGKSSDPQYEADLRARINNEQLSNVEITGFMGKELLFKTIQSALVSATPSRWIDNMPNSLIESQALGLPVVASNFGSFPELITAGINGALFEPENPLDLAEKIYQVISNRDQWVGMHEQAQQWVRSYCSPQLHYDRLINIFSSTIDRNKNYVD